MRFSRAALLLSLLTLGAPGCGSDGERPLSPVPEPAAAPEAGAVPAGRTVPIGGAPEGVVADPATGLLAIALREPARLVVVDHEGRRSAEVALSGPARHLDLAPGGLVLAPAESSDQLVAVELPGGRIRSSVAVGRQPHDAAFAAGRAFAGDELADTVSVVEEDRVVATLPVPTQPGGVASNGRTVVVVGVRGRQMAAIDADTLRPLATVPCGVGPTHVVAGPDGRFYVADTQGEQILVFDDQPSLRQVGAAAARGAPYGIAVDASRQRLWVTLTAANKLVGYDIGGAVPRRVASFSTIRQPNSVAVDPASGLVILTGTATGELQMVQPRYG